jgi:hypothetical protein
MSKLNSKGETMAVICKNVQDWIEENIEKPIEDWENRQEQRCRNEPCNWWTLCLNKLFCWLEWVLVKVVRIVVVTVGKWVNRVVCEVVNFILDVVALVVNLVLSIPIIGGIVRTILNWVTEVIWRIVGLLDFGLSLVGIRPRKRMYVGVIIPLKDGKPIATEADILPQIDKAKELYDRLCNIEIVYVGTCFAGADAPEGALRISCDAGGFFSDWWLGGAYIEVSSATCEFSDGWRRVGGYGAEIIVVVVENVEPDDSTSNTVGCSFASTHNYVIVEATAGSAVAAHEIGHACWLAHVTDDNGNLMWPSNLAVNPTLTNLQISLVRWSKHCVYL